MSATESRSYERVAVVIPAYNETTGADAVRGLPRVAKWDEHQREVPERFLEAYDSRIGDHLDHIHGANIKFSSRAYWRVEGFRALHSGEDVDLVARFEHGGYRIQRDTKRSVVTSARIQARVRQGFAAHLSEISKSATEDVA
jgi:hypothetical protein